MEAPSNKTPLARLLNLFAVVRDAEVATTLLLTLNIFLILTAYLIAKVVREPLILAGGGAEIKSYAAALQVLILVGVVRLYSWLAANFERRKLINYVTLFFSANLLFFYMLSRIGATSGFEIAGLKISTGVIFFLWVGIFSLTIISQFWALANDIFRPEEGKRLFAIIGFGASAGGVVGPLIAGWLLAYINVFEMLLVSAALLLLSLLITNYVYRSESVRMQSDPGAAAGTAAEAPMSNDGAFKVLFQNRYLLLIAFLILFTNWVNTTGEYIVGRVVAENASAAAASEAEAQKIIGEFYAGYFTIVGLVGLLLQLFVVSRIIKWFGIRVGVLVLPAIALGGYFLIAVFPTLLSVIRWAKVAENSTDYSLNNTVRHMLFLPASREEKYKAKVAIDSFFVRAGDVLSAAVVFAGVNWFSFSVVGFAVFNLMLVTVWLLLGIATGRANSRLVES